MSSRPISDCALLSDCRSAALVSMDGSVDWLCLPRFDSPALFARLLDEQAGHWSLRPSEPAETTRRYLPQTLVLETTFRTDTGTVLLHDALALGHRERGHHLAADSPGVLLREATCTEGTMAMTAHYQPRPECGLIHPALSTHGSALRARGGAQTLTLATSLPLRCAPAWDPRPLWSAGALTCNNDPSRRATKHPRSHSWRSPGRAAQRMMCDRRPTVR